MAIIFLFYFANNLLFCTQLFLKLLLLWIFELGIYMTESSNDLKNLWNVYCTVKPACVLPLQFFSYFLSFSDPVVQDKNMLVKSWQDPMWKCVTICAIIPDYFTLLSSKASVNTRTHLQQAGWQVHPCRWIPLHSSGMSAWHIHSVIPSGGTATTRALFLMAAAGSTILWAQPTFIVPHLLKILVVLLSVLYSEWTRLELFRKGLCVWSHRSWDYISPWYNWLRNGKLATKWFLDYYSFIPALFQEMAGSHHIPRASHFWRVFSIKSPSSISVGVFQLIGFLIWEFSCYFWILRFLPFFAQKAMKKMQWAMTKRLVNHVERQKSGFCVLQLQAFY